MNGLPLFFFASFEPSRSNVFGCGYAVRRLCERMRSRHELGYDKLPAAIQAMFPRSKEDAALLYRFMDTVHRLEF